MAAHIGSGFRILFFVFSILFCVSDWRNAPPPPSRKRSVNNDTRHWYVCSIVMWYTLINYTTILLSCFLDWVIQKLFAQTWRRVGSSERSFRSWSAYWVQGWLCLFPSSRQTSASTSWSVDAIGVLMQSHAPYGIERNWRYLRQTWTVRQLMLSLIVDNLSHTSILTPSRWHTFRVPIISSLTSWYNFS